MLISHGISDLLSCEFAETGYLHTLGFLINVQALIKVQGGKMIVKNNRAGSNKRAGGKISDEK